MMNQASQMFDCDGDHPEGTPHHEGCMVLVIDENTSDGFHSFKELYNHRQALTMALFKAFYIHGIRPWRSRLHHDGEVPFGGGWFVVGVTLPGVGKITYHYKDEFWPDFDITGILTLDRAPEWDGADADEVVSRLATWSLR